MDMPDLMDWRTWVIWWTDKLAFISLLSNITITIVLSRHSKIFGSEANIPRALGSIYAEIFAKDYGPTDKQTYARMDRPMDVREGTSADVPGRRSWGNVGLILKQKMKKTYADV